MEIFNPTYFFIRCGGRHVKIVLAEIQYVEAARNYCNLYTSDRMYMCLVPLHQLEAFLPATAFVRIHRSFIVSLNWLVAFDTRQAFGPHKVLPIGEAYRSALARQVPMLAEIPARVEKAVL